MTFERLRGWMSAGLGAVMMTSVLWGAEAGDQVVVVYNSRMPESKSVAMHYAERRNVPADQVLGFALPETEAISRAGYVKELEEPLLKMLRKRDLWVLGDGRRLEAPDGVNLICRVESARFRYLLLCYGVPTTILRDSRLREEVGDLKPELARNEASVDSELTCLPLKDYRRAGPLPNLFYGATNAALLHPTNGVLMVSRLDGPSPMIAGQLVDRAMMADTNGLWGRAYFDARGLREGSYLKGDEWIRAAANICRALGFQTELDDQPATFPASHPLSHIAFYAGWYDADVSGPFTRSEVEFLPGALAYHLHSFSAQTIRSSTKGWVGPLLSRGVTATMGCVDEPYLALTPDISVLFGRFVYYGFSFGEAALAAQTALSWQVLSVGDPLYRPLAERPDRRHKALVERQSILVPWSHLRVADLHTVRGTSPEEILAYLRSIPGRHSSPILQEKTADLYLVENKISDALSTYARALEVGPSPQQKVRIMLKIGEVAERYGKTREAYDIYEKFLLQIPDYPDRLAIYRKLLPLAAALSEAEVVATCQREIERLSTESATPN